MPFMEQMLLVPVRSSAAGSLVLRTGRLPSGERVGLAFTSESALSRTLGPAQWISLAGDALTSMLAPLGIGHFRVDPDRAGQPQRVAPLRPAPPRPRAAAAAITFCTGSSRDAVRPLARRVA
jgi:hypothetical protein